MNASAHAYQIAAWTESPTIMRATLEDAESIFDLVFSTPHPFIRQLDREMVLELARRGELFVARVNGCLIGSCYLRRVNTSTWELGGLYIMKDFRRRGTGDAIITAILNLHRRAHGQATVVAHTLRTNGGAKRLFARLGFLPIERDLPFSKDDLTGLDHMEADDDGLVFADLWQTSWATRSNTHPRWRPTHPAAGPA